MHVTLIKTLKDLLFFVKNNITNYVSFLILSLPIISNVSSSCVFVCYNVFLLLFKKKTKLHIFFTIIAIIEL